MKKSTVLLLMTIVLVLFVFRCELLNPETEETLQVLFAYFYHDDEYWDVDLEEWVDGEVVLVEGVLLADPMPDFEYLEVEGERFEGEEYVDYYLGYMAFGEFGYANHPVVSSYDELLDFEIKTSIGKLSGSIAEPDTITTVSVNDTLLAIGEDLVVSWQGSNADFYEVYFTFTWEDEDGRHWDYHDTLLTSNSVTYDGSNFQENGVIESIRIYPMNGPLAEAGADGNMSGDGGGFLYFEARESARFETEIQIGAGLSKTVPNAISKDVNPAERRRQRIELLRQQTGIPVLPR